MLRSEMVDHIEVNLGNRTGLSATLTRDWLNWGQQDTAAIRNWRPMKTHDNDSVRTKDGSLYYSLPADIKDIIEVSYINGSLSKTLTYIPPEVFRDKFPHPYEDGSNNPSFWTQDGDFIKLYPLPSEDGNPIEIFCAKWPADFNNDADEACSLTRLEHIVIARACVYGATALGDWERVSVYDQQFKNTVKKMARQDGPPSNWTPQWAMYQDQVRAAKGLVVPPVAAGVVFDDGL